MCEIIVNFPFDYLRQMHKKPGMHCIPGSQRGDQPSAISFTAAMAASTSSWVVNQEKLNRTAPCS